MSKLRRIPALRTWRATQSMRRGVALITGTLVVFGAAAISLPASASVFTPAASIDRTGRTDVTTALQRFLTAVPHHSTIAFPAGARYRIEGTLHIARKNDVVIDGHGARFFATEATSSRTRSQWSIDDCSNIVIENMVIQGANSSAGLADGAYVPALEAQHGINIAGGERIQVRHNTITDVYGDFVYVGRSAAPVFGQPTNIRIDGNTFRRNGRQGVSITAASGAIIENNDIADTRHARRSTSSRTRRVCR